MALDRAGAGRQGRPHGGWPGYAAYGPAGPKTMAHGWEKFKNMAHGWALRKDV